ncbi:MAG: Gfo/Idh/MocA family oxidoreductase [Saprospiraceae bacterium]|nr:Gfo/Idh/MocA family oxidoreductase [Saprospiraceae bacterium]
MKTDVLNIGIIGAGKFSHRHVSAIKRIKQCRLVAACRSSAPDLDEFCTKYQIKGYRDYHELLKDPDIDAVLISTPHHLHSKMAIDAARAGKHILLEKPFAPTLDECQRINDESKKAGIKLMVGHTGRFSNCFKETKRLIHCEELGSIVQAISFSNTLWMGPDRKDWHLKKDFGGGYMLTLAVHQIDAILSLVDAPVSSVRCRLGTGFHGWETDDFGTVWINFANGVSATLVYNGFTRGVTKVESEFYCQNGTVKMNVREGTFIGVDEQWSLVPNTYSVTWLDDALANEWQDFTEAIFTDRSPQVSGDSALQVMQVIDAALRSSSLNQEILL